MTVDRVNQEYRGYTLLAALNKGKYCGRAWLDKENVFDLEGPSIENVLKQLHERVDQEYAKRIISSAESRNAQTATALAYIEAFKKIHGRITDSQWAMLRANYRAPNRCLSPLALADAAGFKDIGGVNLWYGFLGQWVFEAMTVPLVLIIENGIPVYTSALASYVPDPVTPKSHEVWKMHEAVATAMEALGLVA